MKKFLQKKLKDQKGMTLIELLAVIVIIAIIAAIAIPAIGGIIENSRVGAVKSDAINIINAAKIYQADTNGTTVTLETLEGQGYIDDAGTFEKVADKKLVSVNLANGAALLSGNNAKTNDIEIKFDGADIAAINGLANGTEVNGTNPANTGTGTVTVISR